MTRASDAALEGYRERHGRGAPGGGVGAAVVGVRVAAVVAGGVAARHTGWSELNVRDLHSKEVRTHAANTDASE